jgi:hypothetical protein
MVAASSVLSLRTQALPKWLAGGGLAIAGLVLVGAFIAAGAVFLLLTWIVIVGIALIAQHEAEPANADSTKAGSDHGLRGIRGGSPDCAP